MIKKIPIWQAEVGQKIVGGIEGELEITEVRRNCDSTSLHLRTKADSPRSLWESNDYSILIEVDDESI
jgi:hypothetical protein